MPSQPLRAKEPPLLATEKELREGEARAADMNWQAAAGMILLHKVSSICTQALYCSSQRAARGPYRISGPGTSLPGWYGCKPSSPRPRSVLRGLKGRHTEGETRTCVERLALLGW